MEEKEEEEKKNREKTRNKNIPTKILIIIMLQENVCVEAKPMLQCSVQLVTDLDNIFLLTERQQQHPERWAFF
jgi:hypothetical protein